MTEKEIKERNKKLAIGLGTGILVAFITQNLILGVAIFAASRFVL